MYDSEGEELEQSERLDYADFDDDDEYKPRGEEDELDEIGLKEEIHSPGEGHQNRRVEMSNLLGNDVHLDDLAGREAGGNKTGGIQNRWYRVMEKVEEYERLNGSCQKSLPLRGVKVEV